MAMKLETFQMKIEVTAGDSLYVPTTTYSRDHIKDITRSLLSIRL